MKAAVLVEEGRVSVEEVEEPAADGWALVSARAAGVCGTELHFLEGMIPPPHERFVLGHESAGVVLETPPGSPVGRAIASRSTTSSAAGAAPPAGPGASRSAPIPSASSASRWTAGLRTSSACPRRT